MTLPAVACDMSRLTLHWHLRGIIEGTTEPTSRVTNADRVKVEDGDDIVIPKSRSFDDGSYTTGFTQDSGRFCTALDVPAYKALQADDAVAFLDRVAHDPVRPFQERHDAAQLLHWHIWPDAPSAGTLGRNTSLIGQASRQDITFSEWLDADMVRSSIAPRYAPLQCAGCTNSETLADPDVLRRTGRAVCMACGTEQEIPQYRRAVKSFAGP